MTSEIPHDPNARLDYGWDWSAWLADGETITSHTVTATGGLVVESSSVISGSVVAWVSGGTPGRASLTVHIVTSAGRADDRTTRVLVHHR